jgi:hypothetical protein
LVAISHHVPSIAVGKRYTRYALQGQIDLAIENLKRALNLNPNLCKELAKTEADLDKIREHEAFKQLIS